MLKGRPRFLLPHRSDTMGLLSRLFAHRKFGHDFVDRGGLHALLQAFPLSHRRCARSDGLDNTLQSSILGGVMGSQVPQDPYLCGSIALCFYGLSCLSTVMERILLFPEPLPSLLVKRTLWILGMPQDNARYCSASGRARRLMGAFMLRADSLPVSLPVSPQDLGGPFHEHRRSVSQDSGALR